MTKEQLQEAMSLIDDKYIAESMTEYKPRMPKWIKRTLATAAMLVLVVSISLLAFERFGNVFSKNDASNMAGEMNGSGSSNKEDDFPEDGMIGIPGIDKPTYGGDDAEGSLTVGDSVGKSTVVTAESYDNGILTLRIDGYVEGAVGVLLLYHIDKVPSYSAFGIDINSEKFEWVRNEYTDRGELISASLDTMNATGRLTVDISGIVELVGSNFSIRVYADGESYRLHLS